MVFKDHSVVVPATLQHTILRHLHEGHMGLEKMFFRASSSVSWPGLTADVDNEAKHYKICQKHAHKQYPEQILVHDPQQQTLGLNFLHIYLISKGNLT